MPKKKLLFFVSLLVFSLLFLKSASAQQNTGINLSVSPATFDYTQEPGTVIRDKIRLRNNSSLSINLKVDIKKLSGTRSGETKIEDTSSTDLFTNWVTFEKPQFTAQAKDYTDIPFTVTIPKDVAFGYYWVFSISQDTSVASPNGATVNGAVAIPVLLRINTPGAKAEASLSSFSVKHFITENLPVEFLSDIQNTGNVHIRPRGNIFIRRGNKDIGLIEINQDNGAILPGSSRTFEAGWTDGFLVREPETSDNEVLRDKNGNPKTKLTIHWDKLTHMRIGPYTANMIMAYDNGTKDVTLEATTKFWVIPYKLIGGMLIIFILLILGLRALIKMYIKSQIRKYRR